MFGIGCLIIGRILFKKMKYYFGKSYSMDEASGYTYGCAFAGVFCGVAIITGLIVVMVQIFDIATCLTFPEKIIIDELESINFK